MNKGSAASLSLFLLTMACSHNLPDYRVQSIAQVPPAGSTVVQSQLPHSSLPVALQIDLSPVQKTLQSAVPDRLTEAGHPLGNDYRWTFLRDGEPTVSVQDGLVIVRSTYKGDLEAKAGARVPARSLVFRGGDVRPPLGA